jgi:hypothetical protein
VSVVTEVIDTVASYTYTSATIRQAGASAGNQISFVTGLAEDGVASAYSASFITTANSGSNFSWGIGLDSTSTFRSLQGFFQNGSATSVSYNSGNTSNIPAQLGFHTISANEGSDGTHANNFNGVSLNNLSALIRM